MNRNTLEILRLCDGIRSSVEIAKMIGLTPRYVRKVAKKHDLPRLSRGAQPGEDNHQFVSGRRIDLDGYVTVSVPQDYDGFARSRPGRNSQTVLLHRLVVEERLGRYLLPTEVVDHKDGLTLHNSYQNLMVYDSNAKHLKNTACGQRMWSKSGKANIGRRVDLGKGIQRIDTHYLRKKRGDVRLRQILLAALLFGIDSPFLLGSHPHMDKAGIDWTSRQSLELALQALAQRWEQDLLQ